MQQTISYEEGKTTGGIFYRHTTSGASSQTAGGESGAKKEALCLVMGYGGSLRVWPETFVNKLAERFDVITYDNRGTGLSFLPGDESMYSTKIMAGDLDEVVTALGIDRFNLMGYSMGGCIAIDYAYLRQDKVKSLFLLSTTAGGKMFAKPDKELSAALANPQGKTLWDVYVSTFSTMYSPESFKRVEPKLRAIYEATKSCPTRPQALAGHSRAFRTYDASAYVNQLRMPITILSGANDRLMPVQNTHFLAEALPDATLVIVPEVEHAVHIEKEDLVVEQLEKLAYPSK